VKQISRGERGNALHVARFLCTGAGIEVSLETWVAGTVPIMLGGVVFEFQCTRPEPERLSLSDGERPRPVILSACYRAGFQGWCQSRRSLVRT
jgi:hypothetical protein